MSSEYVSHLRTMVSRVTNHVGTPDQVFRALGDGTRRRIVERLSFGEASVSQLAAPLQMSLPTVLQHLRVLEDSGIVRTEKAGRVRRCRLHAAALRPVEDWVAARRIDWERRLDGLACSLGEDDDDGLPVVVARDEATM